MRCWAHREWAVHGGGLVVVVVVGVVVVVVVVEKYQELPPRFNQLGG